MPYIPPAPNLFDPRLTPKQRLQLYRKHRKLLVDGAAHCRRMMLVSAVVLLVSIAIIAMSISTLFAR